MIPKVFTNAILASRKPEHNVLFLSSPSAVLVAQELEKRGYIVGKADAPNGIVIAEDDLMRDTTWLWMNFEEAKAWFKHMGSNENIEAVTNAYATFREEGSN